MMSCFVQKLSEMAISVDPDQTAPDLGHHCLHMPFCQKLWCTIPGHSQLAFYVNLHRAVIGPSTTLTGRCRPDIDLRRMLTGFTVIKKWAGKSWS